MSASSGSAPSLQLTPVQKLHTEILGITHRYFTIQDNNAFRKLLELCHSLLKEINASPKPANISPDTYTFEDLLTSFATHTISFIQNKQLAEFTATTEKKVHHYKECLALSFKHNFLHMRTIVALKEHFYERIITLETESRTIQTAIYHAEMDKGNVLGAKLCLEKIIASNNNILYCTSRTESSKLKQAKEDAEQLTRSASSMITKLSFFCEEKNKPLHRPIPIPNPQSLDSQMKTLSISKGS